MFSLSTPFQSLVSSSSNTTNYYGFLSMAIEAMSYWITGSNPRVSAEVEHSIQQPISEEIEIEWESDHQHLRRLAGPEGTEFQVNTYTLGDQGNPSVAVLTNGGFVVSWTDFNGEDGSGRGVFAQTYASDGTKTGQEFQVNTYAYSDQAYAGITSLKSGRFALTWGSGQDGSGSGVFAQCFTYPNIKYGNEFQVNVYVNDDQYSSSIAALTTGGFVISWMSLQGSGGYEIYARLYDENCTAMSAEFLVNTDTQYEQIYPSVSALKNNGFITTWLTKTDNWDRSSARWSYGQCWSDAGTKRGSSFQINTYVDGQQSTPVAAPLDDGGFILTWGSNGQDGDGWGIYAQRFDASCSKIGAEFRVNDHTSGDQFGPAIASLVNGNIIITWNSNGQDGSGNGVYGQYYSSNSLKVGGEFRVNTCTYGDQGGVQVVALQDGGFLAVWSSYGQDSSGYGVFSQRFDADGNKIALLITALPMPSYFPSANPSLALSVTPTLLSTIGPQGTEFQANTYTTDSQYHSAIAALADGGYVITWQSNGQDGSGYGVYAQRYTSSGVPYGSEFRVNTYTADHQYGPAIAALADGGYVITWQSNGQDGSGYGVYAQRYASSGIAYGSEFQVNTYTVDSQYNPAIAALADGGYVITWQGYGQDGSGWGVYAQRYASSGVAYGQEFLMMITYLDYVRNPGIAALADGGYIITSNNYQLVYAQRYASSSATYGLEFQVNSYVGDFYRDNSAIAALADGGYVITWQSYNQDGSAYGVYAQQYAPSGIAYGPEFRVNTYTANNQHVPAIAALADGGYVITWESFDQDRSFSGVYAQRYTSSGVAYGPEFQVNTYTASYESNPAIAALADGGYIITWEGYNQDGSGWGVYAQRFNSNGDKINPRQTSEPTFFPTPAPTPLPTQPTFFPTLSPTALPSFMPTPTPNTYLNLFDGVIYDLQEMSPEKFIATGSVEKYGAGGKDVFLAAFNHDGSIAWSTVFGQTGEDISYSVCVLKNAGNSGYLLAGSSMSTDSKTPRLLLVLVSAQGTIVWAKIMIGMKADLAYAVVETRDGNALIAGTVHSYGAGSSDGFVIKVDINGNRLWAKTVGGVDAEGVFAIKENGVGEIFIAGYTSNAGNKDVLVAKLDASGNLLWLKSIGTAKNEQANGLYLTEDHYIMIAGSTGASETAGLLAKLDASNGALILAMTIADIGDTKVLSIDSSNPDAWIVSGSTSALGGKKTFVLQLTPEGELIRIKRVDRSSQGISTVRRMSTGGYVLAGSSEGGSSESLIAKINNQLEIEDCEGIDDALLTYTDITANMHVANTSFGVRTISPGLLYYSLDSQSIVMTVSNNCAQTPAKKGNQGNPILWIIIGLTVVSSVLGLLIVAGIIFYCYQRTHKKREFTVILPDHDDGVEMTFPVLPSSIQLIPSAELIVDTKEPLGKGGFGIVYAGTWQTTKVAVKQLKAEHLSEKALASFRQEAQQHWSLRHENILILYGISVDTSHPSMVMELMVTSLYHLLRREQTLEWPTRCSIAQDIARGLHYLHNLDILHRDLKSHNILLDQQNRAKLSDFGLSKTRLETTTRDTFTSSTRRAPGTLYWMAPEILDLRAKHTKLSDVYALGMVYWEISSREHPFQEYDNADKGELVKDFIKEGGRLTIPTETPPIFSQLITRCWAQQAADRPVCANIVQELERIREAPDSTPAANFSDPFSSALNKSSIQINI